MDLRSLLRASNISHSPSAPFPSVVELRGTAGGKTLLVTAGMDGDEYAGIEAAFTLIKKYSAAPFRGKLIIIPIVNRSGFLSETSHNPEDNKFPKHIYPGNPRGTASEKLLYWIHTTYAVEADAWIDLHGGALSEELTPFLWCFKTGIPGVDVQTNTFCKAAHAHTIVIDKAENEPKIVFSKKRKAPYILAESGELGKRNLDDSNRHVNWTETLMSTLQMILPEHSSPSQFEKKYFGKIAEVYAPFDGIYTPHVSNSTVSKGETLATITALNSEKTHTLHTPVSGSVVWHKVGMACRKGSTVFGIACDPITLP